jgi:hypothetical protein
VVKAMDGSLGESDLAELAACASELADVAAKIPYIDLDTPVTRQVLRTKVLLHSRALLNQPEISRAAQAVLDEFQRREEESIRRQTPGAGSHAVSAQQPS